MSVASDIAEYIHSIKYSDLNGKTINQAKRLFVDTIGCAIGAIKEQPIKIATKTAQDTVDKYKSTILGTNRKVDPWTAAFVNGGASRYFDFMDTYDAKEFAHPSDNILPIFAIAEAGGKSGKDIILATVIAYEIQAQLAEAASLWDKGWDHVNYGLISVSCAASKLMGLSVEQTTHAINIALSSHLVMRQVRQQEISMWKAFAFSNVARNAIFATMLAKNGMTGPAPIFEGSMGFFKQVSGMFRFNMKKFGNRNNEFAINRNLIKYFPVETRALTTVFAALELRKKFESIDHIQSVIIEGNDATVKIIGKEPEKWDPQTRETADHSMPFIVARALMDGEVYLNTFERSKFRDKKALEFMKRIKVVESQKYTKLFNRGGTVNASSVKINLKNGKKLYREVIYSKGHFKNPMTNQELETKFKRLTSKYLNSEKTSAILSMLWNFEKISKVDKLFQTIGNL